MRNQTRPNNVRYNPNQLNRAAYQPTLWGDTYLTPQEARVYLQQMLQTLKATRERNNAK
jgi:hypothetical protein